MKKIFYKIIIFVIILSGIVLLSNSKIYAASASISANSKEVNVGDNVDINVSVNAATWNMKVDGAGISDSIIGYNADDIANTTTTKSYKLDTSKPGTYTVSLSGDVTDANGQTSGNQGGSVTIKVSEKKETQTQTQTQTQSQTKTQTQTQTQSQTKTQTQTTQEPTFSNSNKTMYATGDINVRSGYSAVSSIAGSLKKGDAVTVVGIGSNGWSKVTYNGKTAYIKTDLLTSTKPEEDKSKNVKLSSLKIEGVNLEPEFNPETLDYKANVGKDVTSLKIDAKAEDEKAKVTIEGNEKLKAGENTVKISVTTEDGAVTTYLIVVTKSESETLGLASLKIDGINLNESFKTDKYEYTVDLKGKEYLTKLNITAKANKEKATVEIIGNDNLQIGENVITIMVKSEDGKENVTYQIIVNKPEMNNSEEIEKVNNTQKFLYISIAIFAIALILIIIIIIRCIKKSKESKEDEYNIDNENFLGINNQDNITEDIYNIKNQNISNENQDETNKEKLYDIEKEVDFSDDDIEKKPRKKGKHSR